jgi:hypothetical protein
MLCNQDVPDIKRKGDQTINNRIPQRILHDGANIISVPMHNLMELIYKDKKAPDQ